MTLFGARGTEREQETLRVSIGSAAKCSVVLSFTYYGVSTGDKKHVHERPLEKKYNRFVSHTAAAGFRATISFAKQNLEPLARPFPNFESQLSLQAFVSFSTLHHTKGHFFLC
ncbi:hypothetical protein INT44_008117 [Umbelopsis vinacea]|uniref:Uncharacterized protein n=1 Tax=Umbelopsis vinacea TaxID=44442 RepID=A0A8H7UC84_9FUNG|nr:hypothetical protein INT44_008117 [Umbelopsis vinacea]